MKDEDNEVFTLWCQSKLDSFTILSIKSWLILGYKVKLYSYEVIHEADFNLFKNENVEFLDASTIVKCPKFEHYAEIADYFRFSKLEQEGGIWIDSDLILLRRIPPSDIIISSERCKQAGAFVPKNRAKTPNIGLLKFPPLHPLISYTVTQIEKRLETGIAHVNNNNNNLMKIFQRRVVKFRNIYWNHVVKADDYCPINWSYVYPMYHKPDLVETPKFGAANSFKFGMVQNNLDYILKNSIAIHCWRNIYNIKGYKDSLTDDCVFSKIKNIIELNYEIKKN